ncbi:hypothetical protein [Nocardioides sp.]|uniref:hypothetical protein n=1 Tax=Nocardioides sp. TaxID=35761 RepID=UPI002619A562|nr:hypothetical protein [Nocardioides sp.]
MTETGAAVDAAALAGTTVPTASVAEVAALAAVDLAAPAGSVVPVDRAVADAVREEADADAATSAACYWQA